MADDLIPNQIIILSAVIGSLLCIYGSNLFIVGGIFSIAASILSALMGTNTLRQIGKYSLGTGVPSIVYMLTAVGLVGYISGIILSFYLNQPVLFPILSILVASIISLTISLMCRYIIGIQVEILSKSFVSIAASSMLLMMSMSTLIAQTWNPAVIYEMLLQNGLIIFIMIASVMIIQNPYNSCMGPNEEQIRTLSLVCSNVCIMLIIVSVISMLNTQYWALYLSISVIGWFIFFRKYIDYTKRQAASIKRYGLWPTDDGDD